MKKVLFFLIAVLFILARPNGANAQYGQYQPGTSLSILVDKLVGVPTVENGKTVYSYVDNLTANDFKFAPDNFVFFKIKVRNTSNTKLENLVIEDRAPDFIDLYDNPGTFNTTNRILTFTVGALEAGEEKEYIIRARIKAADQFPSDKSIFCVINNVKAFNSNVSDDDNAQLCIEKKVTTSTTTTLGVTTIPATGPENGVALLSLSGLMGYLGLRLRKYTA